jgi:hypothetical protein
MAIKNCQSLTALRFLMFFKAAAITSCTLSTLQTHSRTVKLMRCQSGRSATALMTSKRRIRFTDTERVPHMSWHRMHFCEAGENEKRQLFQCICCGIVGSKAMQQFQSHSIPSKMLCASHMLTYESTNTSQMFTYDASERNAFLCRREAHTSRNN